MLYVYGLLSYGVDGLFRILINFGLKSPEQTWNTFEIADRLEGIAHRVDLKLRSSNKESI